MLEWLKNITGGIKIRNKHGISNDQISRILSELKKMDKIKHGISERALRYIVDDEGENVLLELAGLTGCGALLGMHGCYLTNQLGSYSAILDLLKSDPQKRSERFFKTLDNRFPDLYARLAKVLEAASRLERKELFFNVPGVDPWVDILFAEVFNFKDYYSYNEKSPLGLDTENAEKIIEAGDGSPVLLTRLVFHSYKIDFYKKPCIDRLSSIPGFYKRIHLHHQQVIEALNHKHADQRIHALKLLPHPDVDLSPFRDIVLNLAVSSAKGVRKAAEPVILSNKTLFKEPIRSILENGANEQRMYAVSLLWNIEGKSCSQYLKERMETDKSPKVKETISLLLATPSTPKNIETTPAKLELPPLGPVTTVEPLPEETRAVLNDLFKNYTARLIKQKEIEKSAPIKINYKPYTLPPQFTDMVFTLLQETKQTKMQDYLVEFQIYHALGIEKDLKKFLERPETKPAHAVRLLVILLDFRYNEGSKMFSFPFEFDLLLSYYREHHRLTFGLREVAAILKFIGFDVSRFGWSILDSYMTFPFSSWGDSALWPYFAENIDLLEQALGTKNAEYKISDYHISMVRKRVFHILKMFPYVPESLTNTLWEMALGNVKAERENAQEILEKLPGKEPRILEALKSGRQENRQVAAEWLAKLKINEALEPLKKALQKEKSETARGAMMEALEALGAPIDEFLDFSSLKKEAFNAISKGIPEALSWFPFDSLPVVRWNENGEVIDPIILKWFILVNYRLKSPEPGPMLRKYCSYMNKSDRKTLGKFVLDAWLAQDTLPALTHEEASQKAKLLSQSMAKHLKDKKPEDFYQQNLNSYLNALKGSAIKEKGILSITAACGGSECVAPVESYIKNWYGMRAAQCKALIQMLVWIEHPLAVQLLLSISNRFRTQGIREEASLCVQLLAERNGWTIDEMADRTIPAAGFDNTGKMELDFGSRSFTCTLDDDFNIIITNPDGKTIKALPEPVKDDHPEKAAEAKKELSKSKQTLKSILKLQKERLYENMCTERRWIFSDLKMYLFSHPIISRYCRQIVWAFIEQEKPAVTFRPMDDGTLTGFSDDEITVPDSATVIIAHSCHIPKETAEAWKTHFADYNLEFLFPQFRDELFRLPDSKKGENRIEDFKGYMIDNFKLRSLAVKFGYTRSQAEDGGIFYTYSRRFPGLKIEAIIEFSGSPLPEENRPVALTGLYFSSLPDQAADGLSHSFGMNMTCGLPLENIPSVLLNETWNDFRQIAQAGSGYDADWNKKVDYYMY